MPKVKRAKIEEEPKNNTLTLTRTRRTPKPNPKYANDDIIISSESRNSSRSNSLTGFDAKDYDSNEEDQTIIKKKENVPKKRPIVRLENITDIAKAMRESINKSKLNATDDDDNKKIINKRLKNNIEDSDFVATSSNEEDEDKLITRSGRRNLRQTTTAQSPIVINKKNEGIGKNITLNKTSTSTTLTTKTGPTLRTFSPKLKEVKNLNNDKSTDSEMLDFENNVPTFTIVNINDIIKRAPGRPKRKITKKSNNEDDTDYVEEDEEEYDDDEDEKPVVRVTRRSVGDLNDNSANIRSDDTSLSNSGSSNNIDGNRNRRKTLHTTILREDVGIKKGPGRPAKRLIQKPQNIIKLVKRAPIFITNNSNSKDVGNKNGKLKDLATGTLQKATPRILNSLYGKATNQNKIQPIISEILPTKSKVELTTDDEFMIDDFTDNDDFVDYDDTDDDDDDLFEVGQDGSRSKTIKNSNKPPEKHDIEKHQKQLELARLIKSKENFRTQKLPLVGRPQFQRQYTNNNKRNNNNNNNNNIILNKDKQLSSDLTKTQTANIKLNNEKSKLATLMESKPRIVIQNRNGQRIKKITCFETWFVIHMPNITEIPIKSWVLINLINLGNDIKKIKLPTVDWNYRITLSKLKKTKKENIIIGDNNINYVTDDINENKEVYTGEIHDQSINENEKSEYEPINITFQRKSTTQQVKRNNIIEYDRTLSFKNHTYSLIIDGKSCKLIGAPQYIHNLIDIEILLNIVNDISLFNSYVEQNVSIAL